jgi:kumamolisin
MLSRFVSAYGLSAKMANSNGDMVVVSGNYGQARRAFEPDHLGIYDDGERTFVARRGHLHIPAELAGDLISITGFDRRSLFTPCLTGSELSALAAERGLNPIDVAGFYEFPPGLDGTGQTIGILALGGGYDLNSLKRYFNEMMPHRRGTIISVSTDGTANSSLNGDPEHDNRVWEIQMDILIAASIAPEANIVVYFGSPDMTGLQIALNRAVNDNNPSPSVISASWEFSELGLTAGARTAIEKDLQLAKERRITVCAASGDRGGREDKDRYDRSAVSFPASSPNVLSCGGTSLTPAGGEEAWSDQNGSSGGGYSSDPQPDYQRGIIPPHEGRGVPDVCALANPGYSVPFDGSTRVLGGTSAATPLWAALIALINQQTGRQVGFINPTLYQHREAFNDILAGGNQDYVASPGWDPLTGLGSPRGLDILGLFS